MKENEVIGIVGVFVLTFCLIALYHLMGKIGRKGKRYGARKRQAKEPEQDRWSDHDQRRTSGKDDAWLLWSPELGERAGQPRPDLRGHRGGGGPLLRS